MTELLHAVASWPSLVLVVAVFGFAPGFCLRLIVLAYPRSDPRRDELIAELYAVSRIQRPLWVAEQLEVALFEGLAHRLSTVIRQLTARRRAQTTFIILNENGTAYGMAHAVTSYRCPDCEHEIRAGTVHVVAGPAAGEWGSSVDRRHWHTGCWTARTRRAPT